MIVFVNVFFLQYWVRRSSVAFFALLVSKLSCLQRWFVLLGAERVELKKPWKQRTKVYSEPYQLLSKFREGVYLMKLHKQRKAIA